MGMKEFSSYSRFKKIAIKKLAQTLTEEEIRDLKDQFRRIDKDNSGTITHQELVESVRHMRTNSDGIQVISDGEVEGMLQGIDRLEAMGTGRSTCPSLLWPACG